MQMLNNRKPALLDQYGRVIKFSYNAVKSTQKRKRPRTAIQGEDDELNSIERQTLVGTSKDQIRNISVVSWAFRKHLDYVSNFQFQAKTENKEYNDFLERKWQDWSKKRNCDITKRHSLQRLIRLYEASKVIDGDAGLYKLSNGTLQGIEGSRIGKPSIWDQYKNKDKMQKVNEHGLIVDNIGVIKEYCIIKVVNRRKVFDRFIKADDLLYDGYFTRFNQLRGISPLSSAIITFQDLYESWEYALIKAKMHSFFGVAITSGNVTTNGSGFNEYDSYTGEAPTSSTQENGYQFDLNPGLKLELDPGDSIDTIESKTPSAEFRDYTELMLRIGLLAFDIPYTFFDSGKSNYSSMRQDRVEYELSTKAKREANIEILKDVAEWKFKEWDTKNELNGLKPEDIRYDFIAAGQPWIDELKEIQAAQLRIDAGLSTRNLESKKRNLCWNDIAEELQQEEKIIKEKGLIISSGQPGQQSTKEKEAANEEPGNAPANTE